jgi:hypothetical protein
MIERDLLACLASHVNDQGTVLVREEVLLGELEVGREAADAALEKLAHAGLIEVLSPLPFLALKLRTWPGKRTKTPDSGPNAYSSSKQLLHTQRLNSSYRPSPTHGPVDPRLLGEILETLGETDERSFEKAVELYSPHVIRLALDRVRRAKGIRKSRTALFRHLLPRLARDEHRFD